MIDWQIVGVVVATAMATLTVVKLIGGSSWKLSGRITSIEANLIGLQNEMKRLGDVLEKIADMRGDMRVLGERVSNVERSVRDLQHGEGYVLPITKGAYEK